MNRTLAFASVLSLFVATVAGAQQNNNPGNSGTAPGKDRVCLLTFKDEASVAGGANADIVRAQWLPMQAAEAQAAQHPERVLGTQFGPQWTKELCDQFANGNRG
jgi:hypothetical protein